MEHSVTSQTSLESARCSRLTAKRTHKLACKELDFTHSSTKNDREEWDFFTYQLAATAMKTYHGKVLAHLHKEQWRTWPTDATRVFVQHAAVQDALGPSREEPQYIDEVSLDQLLRARPPAAMRK